MWPIERSNKNRKCFHKVVRYLFSSHWAWIFWYLEAFFGIGEALLRVGIEVVFLLGLVRENFSTGRLFNAPAVNSVFNWRCKVIPWKCFVVMHIEKLDQFPAVQRYGFPKTKVPTEAKMGGNRTNWSEQWLRQVAMRKRNGKGKDVPPMPLDHFSHVPIICWDENITLQRNHIIKGSHLGWVILKLMQVFWMKQRFLFNLQIGCIMEFQGSGL